MYNFIFCYCFEESCNLNEFGKVRQIKWLLKMSAILVLSVINMSSTISHNVKGVGFFSSYFIVFKNWTKNYKFKIDH